MPLPPSEAPQPTDTGANTQTPVATETIKATRPPTETPRPTPPTSEEVLRLYRDAYSQLDSNTVNSLPIQATLGEIEILLSGCDEQNSVISPDSPNFGIAVSNTCGHVARNADQVPGSAKLEKFILARNELKLFTGAKMDSLYQRGKFRFSQGEYDLFKQDLLDNYFGKNLP